VHARVAALRFHVGRSPEISIAHEFRPPPYGGANQFLLALRKALRRRGFRVEAYRIGKNTRACVLNSFAFDESRVRRSRRSGCTMLHRVDGPVAAYRGLADGADDRVVELNREFADVTVLQSRYSQLAYEELGIEFRNPTVIPNAVDPEIFYPAPRAPDARLRLITTSWSDNPNKGLATLEWLDANLDPAEVQLTYVGRTTAAFRNIRTVPPQSSEGVADLLRAHDVYLAPSRNDPCSNSLLEALACGLPAIYLESGGHPELVGSGGLGFVADEQIPALLAEIQESLAVFQARIAVPSLDEVTENYLRALGLSAES